MHIVSIVYLTIACLNLFNILYSKVSDMTDSQCNVVATRC